MLANFPWRGADGRGHALALIAAALAFACTPSTAAPSPTPTTSPTVQPSAAQSTSATPSAPASVAGAETEPFVKVLVAQWRPAGPTVFVDRRPGVGQGHVIVAVPLSGGTPTDLVTTTSDLGDWDVRSDGGALVIASTDHCQAGTCVAGPGRLATVDLAAGRAHWITAADASSISSSPVWSPDGAFIYYGAVDASRGDIGIFRIKADGSDRTRITDPVPPAPAPFGGRASSSRPLRVTTNGTLLWVATAGTGSRSRARDLAERSDRTFASDALCVGALAWRASPPSVLVSEGGCHTPPAGLSLWDLGGGARSVVLDQTHIIYDADWDPQGRRIVAAVVKLPEARGELAVIDTGARSTLAGGERAVAVRWLASGVAFIANTTEAPADCVFGIREVRFIAGAAGAAASLYRACALERMRAITGN